MPHELKGRTEHLVCSLEVKATDDEGTIDGYGSVFNTRDLYDDIVAPGAFAATIEAHRKAGTMPAMLWQHDSAAPIGVWTEIAEDKRGLKLAGRIATGTTKGREALDLLRIGALKGLSIGFVSKKWSFDREKEVRTLTEVELWEVSLVTFPANPKASVTTVKGAGFEDIETPRDAERWLREAAGMSRDEAKTIVSRLMKLGADRRDAGESYQRLQQAADRLLSKFTSSGA